MKNKVFLMKFKDELFSRFRGYYSSLKEKYENNPEV